MASKVKHRCVIIAGAPDGNPDFLKSEVSSDDFLICADRGYAHALSAGLKPDLIIGDFDSFDGTLPDDIEVERLSPEKDFSDTLHAAFIALDRGYKQIDLLCALGGRTDHTVSNLYALEYIKLHGGCARILSANEQVVLLDSESIILSGVKGLTFSLYPFGCGKAVVSYRGAKYPLNNSTLESSLPIGLSNEFTSDSAEITVHSGKAILFIIRDPLIISG